MRQHRTCGGGSVVSFVIALPLLLVFLFALVDVGRIVFLHMALADAAHAACSAALESRTADLSPARLQEAAVVSAPVLAAPELHLSIAVQPGDVEELSYAHWVYNGATDAFEKRDGWIKRQPIQVKLTLEGRYLTPLGQALSAAAGRDNADFLCGAQSSGVVDVGLEGGLP